MKASKENKKGIDNKKAVKKDALKTKKIAPKSKKELDDEEDEDDIEIIDNFELIEEEEERDLDKEFEEFDLPKSKTKATPGKKSSKKEELDDDGLGDLGLFNDSFDDEDDF